MEEYMSYEEYLVKEDIVTEKDNCPRNSAFAEITGKMAWVIQA